MRKLRHRDWVIWSRLHRWEVVDLVLELRNLASETMLFAATPHCLYIYMQRGSKSSVSSISDSPNEHWELTWVSRKLGMGVLGWEGQNWGEVERWGLGLEPSRAWLLPGSLSPLPTCGPPLSIWWSSSWGPHRVLYQPFFLVWLGEYPPTVSCGYSSDRRPTHNLSSVFIKTARLAVWIVLSLTQFSWDYIS